MTLSLFGCSAIPERASLLIVKPIHGPHGLENMEVFASHGVDYGKNMICEVDGSCTILAETNGFGENMDWMAIHIDSDGNPIWSFDYGGTATELLYGVTKGTDSGALIFGDSYSLFFTSLKYAGISRNNPRPLLIKISKNGNIEWADTIEGEVFTNTSRDINNYRLMLTAGASTKDGGFLLTGEHLYTNRDSMHVHEDIVVTKIDKNGKVEWLKTYQIKNEDSRALTITPIEDNRFLIGGFDITSHSGLLYSISDKGNLIASNKLSETGAVLAIHRLLRTNDGNLIGVCLLAKEYKLSELMLLPILKDGTLPGKAAYYPAWGFTPTAAISFNNKIIVAGFTELDRNKYNSDIFEFESYDKIVNDFKINSQLAYEIAVLPDSTVRLLLTTTTAKILTAIWKLNKNSNVVDAMKPTIFTPEITHLDVSERAHEIHVAYMRAEDIDRITLIPKASEIKDAKNKLNYREYHQN